MEDSEQTNSAWTTHDDVTNGNIFRVTGHLYGEFTSLGIGMPVLLNANITTYTITSDRVLPY